MELTTDGEVVVHQPTPFWKTPFNHNTDLEAIRTATFSYEPSLTQQHARDETDINLIVERFLKTGQMPQVAVPPTYADFTTTADYHELQNHLAETNALFYKLPASVRASFQNDPAQWVGEINERLADPTPQNLDYLRTMGMDIPPAKREDAEPVEPKGGTTPGAPAPEPPKTGAKAPE